MPDWLGFLRSAFRSPFGVVIAVSDIEPAKQALYRARTKAQDASLATLQIRQSPDDKSHIWITKATKRS